MEMEYNFIAAHTVVWINIRQAGRQAASLHFLKLCDRCAFVNSVRKNSENFISRITQGGRLAYKLRSSLCILREPYLWFVRRLDYLWSIVYTLNMKQVIKSDIYDKWLKKLKDKMGKAIIRQRIDRLANGNPGDVEPIGEGCSELKILFGPGYRVYFMDTGKEIIILLCGGDKSTQQKDIEKAKEIARNYKEK